MIVILHDCDAVSSNVVYKPRNATRYGRRHVPGFGKPGLRLLIPNFTPRIHFLIR